MNSKLRGWSSKLQGSGHALAALKLGSFCKIRHYIRQAFLRPWDARRVQDANVAGHRMPNSCGVVFIMLRAFPMVPGRRFRRI
jgi:hypothetical protein